MFTNKQRHCYVKSSALDPSYVQVVHPTLFDSDRFHNETMCAFDEFYFSMVDEPMIKKLAQATRTLYMEDLTLKFSNIAQEYSRQVKELHDNTMKSLRDACLEVAKSIDDEITWRFAIEPGNERTKAAQNATLTNVFGYNERAQQRRDQELREEFRLRLSRSNAAELSIQDQDLQPASLLESEPPSPRSSQTSGREPQAPPVRTRTTHLATLGFPRFLQAQHLKKTKLAGGKADPAPGQPKVAGAPQPVEQLGELPEPAQAESLKGKVTLSQPETLNIPGLTDHNYVMSIRRGSTADVKFDYLSYHECHSIAKNADGTYTKTTRIPTDSIHMSHP